MGLLSGYAPELLAKHCRLLMARQRGWLLIGLAGPLTIAVGAMVYPMSLAGQHIFTLLVLQLAAGWYLAYPAVYILNHWLAPRRQEREQELDYLPLSAGHFFLTRLLDTCLLPLVGMLLSLPFIAAALYYIDQPYLYWIRGQDDWWLQAALALIVLANATVLLSALAVITQELLASPGLRVIVFLAAIALLWYFGTCWRHHFLAAYRLEPHQGLCPLSLLLPLVLAVLVPGLLAWLPQPPRAFALAAVAVLIASVLVVIIIWDTEDVRFVLDRYQLANDLRISLPYFIAHCNPLTNVEHVLEPRDQFVHLRDDTVGNLIPQRLALWVGSVMLVPMMSLFTTLSLWLGISLRRPDLFMD